MRSKIDPPWTNLSLSAVAFATVLGFGCLGLGCQAPGAADLGLPPGPPPPTFAVLPGSTTLGVLWTPVERAERYVFEASAVAPTIGPTLQRTGTTPGATATDLVAGDHLSVRVRAENEAGTSAWSEPLDLSFAADSRKWFRDRNFQTVILIGIFEDDEGNLVVVSETTDHNLKYTCIAGSGWVWVEAVLTDGVGLPTQKTTRVSRFGTWEPGAAQLNLTSELVEGVLRPLATPVVLPVVVDAGHGLHIDGEELSLTTF